MAYSGRLMKRSNFFTGRLAKLKFHHFLFGLFFVAWCIAYFTGISSVPFHPDEATQIYMSTDVDQILAGNFNSFVYDQTQQDSLIQKYHLLDAPLTRYKIGIARALTNSPQLLQDWNWSNSWQGNSSALPDSKLLLVSRISIAIFLPISLILFFLLTRKLFSQPVAIIASLLFCFNSLLLLHTRRAMAEGLLIFFLILSLYLILNLPSNWYSLTALPVAFAFNSKQTMIVLVGFAFFALLVKQRHRLKQMVIQVLLFSLIFIGIFYLFNPVVWQKPVQVIRAMWMERSELTNSQLAVISTAAPDFIVSSPLERITALIAQVFIVPPATADVANYQEELTNSVTAYFKNPINDGYGRNMNVGFLYFFLVIFGVITSFNASNHQKTLLFLVFLSVIFEILFFFQIPFQRYYLVLIPFTCLYAAVGLENIFQFAKSHITSGKKVV